MRNFELGPLQLWCGVSPLPKCAPGGSTICENRITVTMSSWRRAAVDLLEELDLVLEPAELGIVVLDVARREVADLLHLDVVDHRGEDFLARAVAKPTVIQTTWPRSYFEVLSPSRIVAVFGPASAGRRRPRSRS